MSPPAEPAGALARLAFQFALTLAAFALPSGLA